MKRKELRNKILLCIGIVTLLGLLVWFAVSGDNRQVLDNILKGGQSNEELQEQLQDFGLRGYITVAVFAMLQVVCAFLPAEPVQMLAGLSFGFPVGLACCMAGVCFGNTVVYLLQKLCGDKIRRFFTNKMYLDLENLAHSSKVMAVIFLLYFLPAIPYGMICFFAASVGMKYRRFILVTMLGALPSVCIGVGLGHITIAYSWILAAVLFAVLVAVIIYLSVNREKLLAKLRNYAQDPENFSKTTVQKENGFLLTFLYGVLRIYYFFKGVRIRVVNKCGKQPEKPSIVLCNHGSFIDFVYAETLLRKSRPHFVAARLYFYHKKLGWLLRKLGCFPKSMFALDIESTKNCLRVLQNGQVLAMMPEARLSTVGRFEDIQESTYSFLKKSQVPVYTVKLQGDYFADPKWGRGTRRGSFVEAELDILFTAEQIKALSVEQIKEGVESRLWYDEFQWLETRPKVRYRCRHMAEGLENVLTLCPVCGKQYTVSTKKKEVFCTHCGKLTAMNDRYGFEPGFRFANFADWYHWQKGVMQEQILADPDYTLSSQVELRVPGNGKTLTRNAGSGVCTLDRSGLRYRGTKDGAEVELHFPLKRVYRLLFGAGENFEIYNGMEILYFVPENKQSSVEWYLTSMILYDEAFGGGTGGTL